MDDRNGPVGFGAEIAILRVSAFAVPKTAYAPWPNERPMDRDPGAPAVPPPPFPHPPRPRRRPRRGAGKSVRPFAGRDADGPPRTAKGNRRPPANVSAGRFVAVLSLARQGLSVGVEFGAHSLEALVGIAETVEESVYERGSLAGTDGGIAFALTNPPLRTGAFGEVRLRLDGTPVASDALRVRTAAAPVWRTASSVSARAPLELAAGVRTEFAVDDGRGRCDGELTVRLELKSVAIPPLVWFEFRDRVRSGGPR